MNNTKPHIHIVIEKEQPITTSRNVAENFDKQHKHVLEAIDELTEGLAENSANLFYETEYVHPQNKRTFREIYMTKDGFTLLAMGFTGKKALEFKLAYIDQFNRMEQQLRNQLPGTYKEALIQLVDQVEQNERLAVENEEMKPKADYFDKYIKNKGVTPIGVIAENYGLTAQEMNKLLHKLGVQYNQGKVWKLYAKHKGKGYTHMEGFEFKDSNENTKVNYTMKWHPKGHHFIYELLRENGILPMIERDEENDLS